MREQNKQSEWDELNITQKSDFMKLAIDNGIYKINDIHDLYNKYADGGYTNSIADDVLNINNYTSNPDEVQQEDSPINYDMEVQTPVQQNQEFVAMQNNTYDYSAQNKQAAAIVDNNNVQYNNIQNQLAQIQIPQDNNNISVSDQLKYSNTVNSIYDRSHYNNITWANYMANIFSDAAKQSGINLSSNALYNLVAQAAYEGNYGNSKVALANNNFGGVKEGNRYKKFNSPKDYALNQLQLLKTKYPGALEAKDSLTFANILKKHGYMGANATLYGNNLRNMNTVRKALSRRR